ncbi:MAG TPA: hypothetical protein VF263_15310 [Longimicrobiaceae bacterium]
MDETTPAMREVDPSEMRAPGGCGCGVGGCLTVLAVVCALLLGTLILMALTREWPRPLVPM